MLSLLTNLWPVFDMPTPCLFRVYRDVNYHHHQLALFMLSLIFFVCVRFFIYVFDLFCFPFFFLDHRQALPHVMNDAWRLTFINNANAVLLFIPFVLYFEGGLMWAVR